VHILPLVSLFSSANISNLTICYLTPLAFESLFTNVIIGSDTKLLPWLFLFQNTGRAAMPMSLWLSVLFTSAQMLQLQFKGIADTKWKVTTIGFESVP
jgi:hypothetical protein